MKGHSTRSSASTADETNKPRTSPSLGLRWASALVLVPLTVLATWVGGLPFQLLVTMAAVLMAFEWNRLVFGEVVPVVFMAHALTGVTAIVLTALGDPQIALLAVAGSAAVVSALAYVLGQSPLWTCIGIVYTSLPCVGFVWMREQDIGLQVTISLLFVVWATDTGAYLFGRTIGGPKLAPRLSPSKTWAGLGGAMFWASVFAAGAAYLWDVRPLSLFAAIGALLGLLGQVGDFAESAVKRHFNAKDTSGFIPGHGGVLDRLDGLMFAVLAVSLIMLVDNALS